MCTGYAGYFIFSLLRIPAPALMGAFAIVGLSNLFGIMTLPAPHPYFFIAMQILLGMFVGITITPRVYKDLIKIRIPAIIMIIWALGIAIGVGFLLSRVTPVDFKTGILAASPAGLAEMGIVAISVGADVGYVSLLQILRLILSLLIFPLLAKHCMPVKEKTSGSVNIKQEEVVYKLFSYPVLKTLVIALGGGLLGNYFSLPAGGMLGALFGTSIISLAGIKLEAPPQNVHGFMQIGIGVVIGFNLSPQTLSLFGEMFLPIFLCTMFVISTSFLMAAITKKFTGWEWISCILAAAPSGFTAVTIIASELDAHPLEVTLLQLTRLLIIKTLIPFLVIYI